VNDGAQRELVRELSRECDVLIENFTVGTMERLGLGPEDLHRLNPGLVYAGTSTPVVTVASTNAPPVTESRLTSTAEASAGDPHRPQTLGVAEPEALGGQARLAHPGLAAGPTGGSCRATAVRP
jgi:hypothetical protein